MISEEGLFGGIRTYLGKAESPDWGSPVEPSRMQVWTGCDSTGGLPRGQMFPGLFSCYPLFSPFHIFLLKVFHCKHLSRWLCFEAWLDCGCLSTHCDACSSARMVKGEAAVWKRDVEERMWG